MRNVFSGKTFDGDARSQTKHLWSNIGNQNMTRIDETQDNNQRSLSPAWWRGVKVCFVCGKDHTERSCHGKEEVRKFNEKCKPSHPQALLAVTDLAFILRLTMTDTNVDEEHDDDDDYVK